MRIFLKGKLTENLKFLLFFRLIDATILFKNSNSHNNLFYLMCFFSCVGASNALLVNQFIE